MREAGAGITGLQEAVITLNTYKYDSENFKKDFQGKTKGSAGIGKPFLVGRGGFEPPKSVTTDLQSVPFGRSGTLPRYSIAHSFERSNTIAYL